MPTLRKFNLLQVVENAITKCGWSFSIKDDSRTHPFRLSVFKGKENFDVRIYIWNLSHGGGTKRPAHEYRIQITGINRFEKEKGEKSLILGWWSEREIFAGFDFTKHTSKLGFSSSMQIIEDTLLKAETDGIATYKKGNDEIAVAFRPDHFIEYLRNTETIHSLEQHEEIIDESENDEIEFRYMITSYGADYPVDAIVKRIEDDLIFVPPFQRNFVWDIKRASKFIESLLIGLPVPGIFLSKEDGTGRFLIIDGQQRLLSLYAFYQGEFKDRLFELESVQSDLIGITYKDLKPIDKSRLDNSIIHATIIKQDHPDDNQSSIYLIYERLNTGGKLLNAQEIRASIYYGTFNELLNDLANFPPWRELFGRPNERLKEQELILRFFALYFDLNKYKKPLKGFLNEFMASNRQLQKHKKEKLEKIFFATSQVIKDALGKKAFRIVRGINTAVYDAVMVGVAHRLNRKGAINNLNKFVDQYNKLLADSNFGLWTRGGTSDDASVEGRIKLSIKFFKDLR